MGGGGRSCRELDNLIFGVLISASFPPDSGLIFKKLLKYNQIKSIFLSMVKVFPDPVSQGLTVVDELANEPFMTSHSSSSLGHKGLHGTSYSSRGHDTSSTIGR